MSEDVLRQSNYGIPVGETLRGMHKSFYHQQHGNDNGVPYTYQYEFCDPKNKKLGLRRGDMIRFYDGMRPKYAARQTGVVLDRYKIVKFKYATFHDYHALIMMTSGPKKGHVFRMPMNRTASVVKEN